jgi:hypothetical protein
MSPVDVPMESHQRTAADVSLWPLRLWSDRGGAHIECGECDSGDLLVAEVRGRPFMVADLIARVETHIARCRCHHATPGRHRGLFPVPGGPGEG